MASETKPTVLDLWVCPSCGDHSHFDRWHPDSPRCSGHIPPVAMVRRRALVLDDAAVEAGAQALRLVKFRTWLDTSEAVREQTRVQARAVLGMEESDG